jgi:hypothetical protein
MQFWRVPRFPKSEPGPTDRIRTNVIKKPYRKSYSFEGCPDYWNLSMDLTDRIRANVIEKPQRKSYSLEGCPDYWNLSLAHHICANSTHTVFLWWGSLYPAFVQDFPIQNAMSNRCRFNPHCPSCYTPNPIYFLALDFLLRKWRSWVDSTCIWSYLSYLANIVSYLINIWQWCPCNVLVMSL